MKRALTFILLAGGAAASAAAQPAGDEVGVQAAVSGFHAALSSGDAAGAMALVAEDALFLEAGRVETRAEYEKDHLPATSRSRRASRSRAARSAWSSSATRHGRRAPAR